MDYATYDLFNGPASPNTTRLFLEWQQITPDNSVLTFNNETGVANYYGVGSVEAKMASEYFTGPYASSAAMLFTRVGMGQRPHLLGANLSGLSLAGLQTVNGSLSMNFDGYTYSGKVNLARVSSFSDAAMAIQTALHNLPVTATTTGDWIETKTIPFMGYTDIAQLYETSGPPLVIGGKITGPNIKVYDSTNNQIIYGHKTVNGVQHYSCFANIGPDGAPPTPYPDVETYSILHIGNVTSGAIAVGQHLIGPGIPDLTSVIGDLGNGEYILNNPISASGNFETTAPPLEVTYNSIKGQTQNHDWFSVQPNGAFGFDNDPSDMGFMTGSAANVLGLSQLSGALGAGWGGQHPTMATFMNQVVTEANAQGAPFDTFQSQQIRFDHALSLWASDHPAYAWLPGHTSTPPAGSVEAGAHGDWGVSAWSAVGHGPGV